MVSLDDLSERRERRELVRRGYDSISYAYRPHVEASYAASGRYGATYRLWIDELAVLLDHGAAVLDLGCGAGIPTTRLLVDHGFDVTGVDISDVQIDRARSLVPEATFVRADMATWHPGTGPFDAIVSLYALIHLPLQDQHELIDRLPEWLAPGGYLLAIVGHQTWSGVEDYLGAPMFWEHADAKTYRRWLRQAGMEVVWHRFVADGTSGHSLVLARRSG